MGNKKIMKNVYHDDRVVMTLDAGGTNLVFSALQLGREMIAPIKLSAHSDDLDVCLKTIINGFELVKKSIAPKEPVAISFAFPGPADYVNGIIGDLPNFPSFRGGIALGPMLEEIFGIPTLINNDGDLFTYGEAVAGFLPYVNQILKENKVDKKYNNLIGITLGTGFGGGIVINNQICLGDNSASGEIWLTRNYLNENIIAEESVSIRAIQRTYTENSNDEETRSPWDIYRIAKGELKGDQVAAIRAFEEMATVIGESLANAITLLDAPVVIGGGIAGAAEFIIPKIVEHLHGYIKNGNGEKIPRIIPKVFDLDNLESTKLFISNNTKEIKVPFSDKKVAYNEQKRIPIGLSQLGTSEAVWLGAYTLALEYMDSQELAL